MAVGLIGTLLGFAFSVGIILGVYAFIWWLWCGVLGYFWPAGPEQIIDPGFWPFVGLLLLLSIIGRILFKRNTKE